LHPVLFADSFDSDTSANWNLFWGAANGIPDYTVDWEYDYGATPYTFTNATAVIPPAPNSPDGSTRGIRFTVNSNDTNAATAAVNIYPKFQSFSSNYALKFDLWINYPGPAGGSVGSTEHAIFGINHLGTEVSWAAPSAASSDGTWFGVDGEGGDSKDFRAYVGNPGGTQIDLESTGGSGLPASNNIAPIYQTLFPAARFETAGAPGKNWVEAEVRQTNNVIVWLLDGTVVAQRTNTSNFKTGNIMLGYMDPFSSIATAPQDAFVLFDNVRVEDLNDRFKFLSADVLTNGSVQLMFSATPGQTYIVEASTNLSYWTPIQTVTSTNGPLSVVDTTAPNFNRRFYRAHATK
jgi:hypothetical protein